MTSKQEVQHIAKLARLGLADKEIEKFQSELATILGYVGKLKQANVSKVKPCTHPFLLENVLREDIVKKQNSEMANRLVEMAPEKKNRYVKVKSVL